ncbi:MAG: type II secretion system F family protein [Clostridiales bacterium]|jgi:type IV pilus assembly protein PilC|nr:type II secretion system F family protein [Clostridiales bacterium]
MAFFSYLAIDASGQKRKGQIEKDSMADATDFLKRIGLFPLNIRKKRLLDLELSELEWLNNSAALTDLASSCRAMSFILGAGVELSGAFAILTGQAPGAITGGQAIRQKDRRFQKRLAEIYERLLKGQSLSACYASVPFFPPLLSHMCRVGERSGRLPEVMETLADYYEHELKNRQSLQGAMIYPAIVSVMMIGVIILTLLFVIPSYAQIFEAEDLALPWPTQIMMSLSQFLTAYPAPSVMAAFASAAGPIAFFKSGKGKMAIEFLKARLPGLKGFCRQTMNLRFCRCLSIMLGAGETLPAAVETAGQVLGGSYFTPIFQSIRVSLEEGRPFWATLTQFDCFDPMLTNMARIGEETGQLAETLQKCAAYFQNKSDHNTALLNRLIEPGVILVLGVVLGFITLSVILPTFTLTSAM